MEYLVYFLELVSALGLFIVTVLVLGTAASDWWREDRLRHGRYMGSHLGLG